MPIQTQCQFCGKKINAGDAFAGKSVKCPGCGGVIKIPTLSGAPPAPPQNAPPQNPPQPQPPRPQQFGGQPPFGNQPQFGGPSQFAPPPAQQPIYQPQPIVFDMQNLGAPQPGYNPDEQQAGSGERRPCPACGELIMRDAAKCRFCGEVFDGALGRTGGRTSAADDAHMNGLDWFMAIIPCVNPVGCVTAIVYLIQGKGKGAMMLGMTVAFAIGWFVVMMLVNLLVVANNPGLVR